MKKSFSLTLVLAAAMIGGVAGALTSSILYMGQVAAQEQQPPELTLNQQSAFDSFPKGTILMWNKRLGVLPSKWHPCNGENGTPNLQEHFVRGAKIEIQKEGELLVFSANAGETHGSDTHGHSGSVTVKDANPNDKWTIDDNGKEGAPQTTGLGHKHDADMSVNDGIAVPKHVTVVFIQKIED